MKLFCKINKMYIDTKKLAINSEGKICNDIDYPLYSLRGSSLDVHQYIGVKDNEGSLIYNNDKIMYNNVVYTVSFINGAFGLSEYYMRSEDGDITRSHISFNELIHNRQMTIIDDCIKDIILIRGNMVINVKTLDGIGYLVSVRSQNSRSLQNKIYDKAAQIAADCISRTHSRLFSVNHIKYLQDVCIEKADEHNELKGIKDNTYWLEIVINER